VFVTLQNNEYKIKWSSLAAKKQKKISVLLRKKYDKIDYEFDNIQEICQKTPSFELYY
jgi:hypothetical protein